MNKQLIFGKKKNLKEICCSDVTSSRSKLNAPESNRAMNSWLIDSKNCWFFPLFLTLIQFFSLSHETGCGMVDLTISFLRVAALKQRSVLHDISVVYSSKIQVNSLFIVFFFCKKKHFSILLSFYKNFEKNQNN